MRRSPVRSVLVSCGLAALAFGACAPGEESLSTEEIGDDTQRLAASPGDLVTRDGVTVVAPGPGGGIWAELLLETGETRTLHLRTDASRQVFLVREGHGGTDHEEDVEEGLSVEGEAAGEATASGSVGPCKDGAKSSQPWKWSGPFRWRFNDGSTPAANSVAKVEAKLKQAASNITQSRNSCGLADQVGATHEYLGRTDLAAQIGADASCIGAGNGVNTVGFGALPDGVLGLACVWYDASGPVEADVRFNKARAWIADMSGSCSGRWSVEAVATHEFGHVFGLGHVGEAAHGNLTMSPKLNGPCQNAEATLGLGDVLALRGKY